MHSVATPYSSVDTQLLRITRIATRSRTPTSELAMPIHASPRFTFVDNRLWDGRSGGLDIDYAAEPTATRWLIDAAQRSALLRGPAAPDLAMLRNAPRRSAVRQEIEVARRRRRTSRPEPALGGWPA